MEISNYKTMYVKFEKKGIFLDALIDDARRWAM